MFDVSHRFVLNKLKCMCDSTSHRGIFFRYGEFPPPRPPPHVHNSLSWGSEAANSASVPGSSDLLTLHSLSQQLGCNRQVSSLRRKEHERFIDTRSVDRERDNKITESKKNDMETERLRQTRSRKQIIMWALKPSTHAHLHQYTSMSQNLHKPWSPNLVISSGTWGAQNYPLKSHRVSTWQRTDSLSWLSQVPLRDA